MLGYVSQTVFYIYIKLAKLGQIDLGQIQDTVRDSETKL